MDFPASFIRQINVTFGERGAQWLAELPALLDAVARCWDLTLGAPFVLSYNYVMSAWRSDGTPVVLKLGVPGSEDMGPGLAAMVLYDGRGCVRVLEADVERGVALLERLLPGETLVALADHNDEQATRIAAELMQTLWRPVPSQHNFITVEHWAADLTELRPAFGGTGPFPAALVREVEELYPQLLATQAARVVLHGDLHHENILSAQRAPWLAIDPKGVIGEPVYETGALLRNPIPYVYGWRDLLRITERRIAVLAETLGFERRRIRDWALCQALLSTWWDYEDDGVVPRSIVVVEVLHDL
jgi:streptomycin 6-kinase